MEHIIDLSCSEKILESFKKYVYLKLLIFDPPSPLFIPVCSFYMYLPPPAPLLPPKHMFALVSYPIPSQKMFHNTYVFLNEKSRSEKRENNYFFVCST